MRHDQRGPALHQPVQRALDRRLVLRIDARQRLVQDQHRRIAQQRPRDRKPLALAARQSVSALTNHRRIALWQRGDELMRICRPGRGTNLVIGRIWLGESQIGQHRPVEQVRVLEHHRHLRADIGEAQIIQLATAQPDCPLLRRVQTLQQPDQRRFSRPRSADHADSPARLDRERHSIQRRASARRIAEGDILELDPRLQRGHRLSRGIRRQRLRPIQIQHTLSGRDAQQSLMEELAQFSQGTEDFHAQHQHDQQLGQLHRAALDSQRADEQRDRRANRDCEDCQALGNRVVEQHAHRRAEHLLRPLR